MHNLQVEQDTPKHKVLHFFVFNSLIYFEVSYNSGLGNSVIVSYSLNENTLNINLRRFLKLTDYDVVTKDIYVLEINKYVANKTFLLASYFSLINSVIFIKYCP